MERKFDGKFFAMKHVKDAGSEAEMQAVINEASLIAHLDSKEMI